MKEERGVEIMQTKDELGDAGEALLEDQELGRDFEKAVGHQEAPWPWVVKEAPWPWVMRRQGHYA